MDRLKKSHELGFANFGRVVHARAFFDLCQVEDRAERLDEKYRACEDSEACYRCFS